MTNELNNQQNTKPNKNLRPWLAALLLVYILGLAAYLRFSGTDWDEDQHLHPDERFLTMVTSAITPVESLGDYFDTANSSLNPHNRGHTFYVYGTLPLIVVRYVGEWFEMTGYGGIHLVGRALSATVELLTVFLVFLTAERLYDRRVGVLAAAFSAVTVLPVQQSHFYTVDTFASFFMMLAVYCAALIATSRSESVKRGVKSHKELTSDEPPAGAKMETALGETSYAATTHHTSRFTSFFTHPLLWPSIVFGIVLGMAVASKINAAPIAIILPLAAVLYLFNLTAEEQRRQAPMVFAYLVLAGVISLISFRIFQPYAFNGPGFFGMKS